MSLEDLGSVNGTRIKDQAIQRGERVSIRIGDTIQIGSSVLIVQRRTAPVEEMRPETLRDDGAGDGSDVAAAGRGDEADPRAGRARRRRDHQRPHHRRDRRRQGAPGRDGAPRCRRGATGRTSVSTARRCPRRCSRASCSVTSAARSPAPWQAKPGLLEAAARRHAVPRRGGRAAAGDPGQAAARDRDARGDAPRQRAPAPDRRALHRGDQPRSRGRGGARRVPPRSLLPLQRHHADDPAAARARVEEIRHLARAVRAPDLPRSGARAGACCRRRSSRCSSRTPGRETSASSRTSIERAVLLCAGPDASGPSTCRWTSWRPRVERPAAPPSPRVDTQEISGAGPSATDHRRAERLRRQPEPRGEDAGDAAADLRQQAGPLQDPAPQKEERRRYGELARVRRGGWDLAYSKSVRS